MEFFGSMLGSGGDAGKGVAQNGGQERAAPPGSNEDVALVHVALVLGLKDATRKVVRAAVKQRERVMESARTKGLGQGEEELELTEESLEVANLLKMLELCLWHGLRGVVEQVRSPSRGSELQQNPLLRSQQRRATRTLPLQERHFWDFVLALESANRSVFSPTIMMVRMNSKCKTPRGLCRAWLRQVLNQNALEYTLRALAKAVSTTGVRHYEDWAFLRWSNEPNRSMLFNLLSALNNIGFQLNVAADLDGPAPSVPGDVLTAAAVMRNPVLENAVASSACAPDSPLHALLLVSQEDLRICGRYVPLAEGLWANEWTGCQVRFEVHDGVSAWGIFTPDGQDGPLYLASSADARAPPTAGWAVENRPGIFRAPAVLLLRHPAGLRSVLDATPTKVSKDRLLREEIQTLRVEIMQLAGYRTKLDELRKVVVEDLKAQHKELDTGEQRKQDQVEQEVEEEEAVQGETSEADRCDGAADTANAVNSSPPTSEGGESDGKETEHPADVPDTAPEPRLEEGNEDAQVLAEQGGQASPPGDGSVSASLLALEPVDLDEQKEVDDEEADDLTDCQQESLASDQEEGEEDAKVMTKESDNADIEFLREGFEKRETSRVDEDEDGCEADTVGTDSGATTGTVVQDENERKKKKEKRKGTAKRKKKIKMATFNEDEESFMNQRTSVRIQERSSLLSVRQAQESEPYPRGVDAVTDDLSAPQTDSSKGGAQLEEETEEERMERYRREEEESLAEFMREQEEARVVPSKKFDLQEESGASLSGGGHQRSAEDHASDNSVKSLVREYVSKHLDGDQDSADAKSLALEIHQRTGYVIGPFDLPQSRGVPFFEKRGQAQPSSAPTRFDGTDAAHGQDATRTDESDDADEQSVESGENSMDGKYIDFAQVVGQHISKETGDQHVKFVIRVGLTREGDEAAVLRGDASILGSCTSGDQKVAEAEATIPPVTTSVTVQRRFSEFKALRAELQASLGKDTELPQLPKTAWMRSFSEDYITRKRIALDGFLQELLALHRLDEPLSRHPVLVDFLTKGGNWNADRLEEDDGTPTKIPAIPMSQHIAVVTEERPDSWRLQARDSEGLLEQDFKCGNCTTDISIALVNSQRLFSNFRARSRGSARFCHYTERWYCPSCFDFGKPGHEEEDDEDSDREGRDESSVEDADAAGATPGPRTRPLPTRVVHHWDFKPRPVSAFAAKFLDSVFVQPILCVSALNPRLFAQVKELQHARLLRLQLLHAREAVDSCPRVSGVANIMMPMLEDQLYLSLDTEMYSMSDLVALHDGSLMPVLIEAAEHLADHITKDCDLCHAGGQMCRLCDQNDLVYAFQVVAVAQCRKCKTLFHRKCFASIGGEANCPRCHRRR
ncbi:Differentially expressed in FDCP 8 homolog B (DEF-8-B) [Durusdinium trenchii]|uniref:Differentially expressed in FDCP 8 homolog B (DEF-8-B) n=1 Tax=Durusdinium trenchii TaxID=1381693 RepID=A0ABP0RBN1_9DINO